MQLINQADTKKSPTHRALADFFGYILWVEFHAIVDTETNDDSLYCNQKWNVEFPIRILEPLKELPPLPL